MPGSVPSLPIRALAALCAADLVAEFIEAVAYLDRTPGRDSGENILHLQATAGPILSQIGAVEPRPLSALILMSPDEVQDHLTQDPELTPPCAEACIVAWLKWFRQMPSTRKAFATPDRFTRITDRFKAAGFLTISPEGLHWSDAAAPLMQAADLWDPDGLSKQDVTAQNIKDWQNTQDAKTATLIRTLPPVTRQAILAEIRTHGTFAAIKRVPAYYRNGTWLDAPAKHGSTDIGLTAATAIVRHVASDKTNA